MPQYSVSYALSALNGANGFALTTDTNGALLGVSVSGVGDINGDGLMDVIVGSAQVFSGPGGAYVVFGTANTLPASFNPVLLEGATSGFRLNGVTLNDATGLTVSGGGDVNGDGFADMLVGAPTIGRSYLVFGKAGGWSDSLDLSTLNGTNGVRFDGVGAGDGSSSVSAIRDINGDGYDDLIIGASGADPGGDSNAGSTYVVFGKAAGWTATMSLASLDTVNGFRLDGITADDESGLAVSSADVNGDGFADLLIGAGRGDPSLQLDAGEGYVVFGKASGFTHVDLSTLSGTDGFRVDGGSAGDRAGYSIKGAGDVNGDGIEDFIVGAYLADTGGNASGSAYVVFGKASGWSATLQLTSLNGVNGFALLGADAGDGAGEAVAAAGDVNGDGFGDILVGARSANAGAGAAYVIFGKPTWAASMDLSTINGDNGYRLDGVTSGALAGGAGNSVAGIGDFNGDGLDDFVIGAAAANTSSGPPQGESYIVYGRLPGIAVARSGTALDNRIQGGVFNDTLSGLGGDDTLLGNGGDDFLTGGTGVDVLNGGDGFDTASFAGEASGVAIDLSAPSGPGDDTLISVEAVVGTAHNDTLTGDGSDNALYGGLGNNTLDGGLGTDIGGADFSDRVGDVMFTLAAGGALSTLFVGGVASGAMVGIERVELSTGAGGDTLFGGALADVFRTGAATDRVRGGDGADQIFGEGGVDILQGDGGDDIIDGGTETDYLYGRLGADTIYGRDGNDNMFGDEGDDVMFGDVGVDQLLGDAGADALSGEDGDDYLYGEADNDTLNGGLGNDRMYGGLGVDTMHGGDGVDVLVGQDDGDVMNGDGGNDYLYAGAGDDTVNGGDGEDVLLGEAGNDTLSGGFFDDAIYGDAGDDTIFGGSGNDYAYGGADGDAMNGGGGNDVLIGESGVDVLNGDANNDYLFGGDGNDVLSGWTGNDNMYGDAGNDDMVGGDGLDIMLGDIGADTINGGNDGDYLYGEDGDDTLNGDAGADSLYGGAGADYIHGGLGNDVLRGGADADRFAMQVGGGADFVVDFQDGVDRVDLTLYAGANFSNLTLTAFGGDTQITLSGGETIYLLGVSTANITAADFIFTP